MKLKIVLESSPDGGFTVFVPSLPGCVSEGETHDEALANIREAIDLYLEPTEDDLPPMENAEIEIRPRRAARLPSFSMGKPIVDIADRDQLLEVTDPLR